jgi:hypothetical protein
VAAMFTLTVLVSLISFFVILFPFFIKYMFYNYNIHNTCTGTIFSKFLSSFKPENKGGGQGHCQAPNCDLSGTSLLLPDMSGQAQTTSFY